MTQPKSNQQPKEPEQPPVQQEMQGQGLTPEAIQSFLGQGGGGMM